MARHVLIGGGTGFIGSNLKRHLVSEGYKVTVVSRKAGEGHIHWDDLEQNGIPCDITEVVNVSGQNVLDPTRLWSSKFKQMVWDSRINSSENLVKAIVKSPLTSVQSFINICGVSHYMPSVDKIYTESDEVQGYDYMSNLCLHWEKAAMLPSDFEKNIRLIRLRTGVVIGRGGGMIKSIWLPFYLGAGGPIGDGKQILPWIHIEDLCRLIKHCLECSDCSGAINAVAPDITTNGEFSKIFASSMHRPCYFNTPASIVKLIFGKERSSLLLTGAKIKPESALNTGFEFKYPTVKEACEQIINGT